MSEEQQTTKKDVPVWETILRLDKNTIISYGPWADKQRATLYDFFLPSDSAACAVTEMPMRGSPRIYIHHSVQIFFTDHAMLDVWFLRKQDELNAIHMRLHAGSSFEVRVNRLSMQSE